MRLLAVASIVRTRHTRVDVLDHTRQAILLPTSERYAGRVALQCKTLLILMNGFKLFLHKFANAFLWIHTQHSLLDLQFHRIAVGFAEHQNEQLSRRYVIESCEYLTADLVVHYLAAVPA